MCPPQQCCCQALQPGLKCWNIVLIVFSAIAAILALLVAGLLSTYHNTWCTGNMDQVSAEHKDGCATLGAATALYWFIVVVYALDITLLSWGQCQIGNFKAAGLQKYWKFQLVILFIQLIINFVATAVDKATAHSTSTYLTPLVGFGFGLWFVYAIKTLAYRIEKGEISAQNPDGLPGMQGQQAGAVPVVQAQAVPVQAMAVPVQAVPVQAVAVPAKQ